MALQGQSVSPLLAAGCVAKCKVSIEKIGGCLRPLVVYLRRIASKLDTTLLSLLEGRPVEWAMWRWIVKASGMTLNLPCLGKPQQHFPKLKSVRNTT